MIHLSKKELFAVLIAFGTAGSQAAHIRDTASKTTAECQAEVIRLHDTGQ